MPQNSAVLQLLETSAPVGALVKLDYSTAVIATTDEAQEAAGGIPRNCFLLAMAGFQREDGTFVPEGNSAVLLTVAGVAPLATLREMDALRESLALRGASNPNDPESRRKLQTMGFTCSVAGTFYEVNGELQFGGDLDRVLAHNAYRIFKPRGRSLSLIASFSAGEAHRGNPLSRKEVPLGIVRYSETRPEVDQEATVTADIRDFLGKKTAVFAMTRAGKSNTIKVLAESTMSLRNEKGQPVYGQLIFDPQGEYANENEQDKGSLASLGTGKDTCVYRLKLKPNFPGNQELLKINFLEEENLELVWELLMDEIDRSGSRGANYLAGLKSLTFEAPSPELDPGERKSQKVHYDRRRLGVYALMHKARISGTVKSLYITVGEGNVPTIMERAQRALETPGRHLKQPPTAKNQVQVLTPEGAYFLMAWLMEQVGSTKDVPVQEESDSLEVFPSPLVDTEETSVLSDSWRRSFNDGEMKEFALQFIRLERGQMGSIAALKRISELHDASAQGDMRKNVWENLKKGRLIILDLSLGSGVVATVLSERLMHFIMDQASERFTSGLPAVPMQVIVEEAHNLFRRDGQTDDGGDPWVRLSKEAAKYMIGLIYATQEVTSVDPRILSNTSNWIIGALNSKHETRALAAYYTFDAWEEHIRTSESKGFIRMKTFSCPFIVPVQVRKFEPKSRG